MAAAEVPDDAAAEDGSAIGTGAAAELEALVEADAGEDDVECGPSASLVPSPGAADTDAAADAAEAALVRFVSRLRFSRRPVAGEGAARVVGA